MHWKPLSNFLSVIEGAHPPVAPIAAPCIMSWRTFDYLASMERMSLPLKLPFGCFFATTIIRWPTCSGCFVSAMMVTGVPAGTSICWLPTVYDEPFPVAATSPFVMREPETAPLVIREREAAPFVIRLDEAAPGCAPPIM